MNNITEPIYLDIETIPTQDERHIAYIRKACEADREAALAEVKAPGNIKDPDKIAEALARKKAAIEAEFIGVAEDDYRKTSLDGGLGHVVVCSVALGDEPPTALYDIQWREPGYEAWLLNQINAWLTDAAGASGTGRLLVGHNILGFDRKFLRQRGIVRKVRMHRLLTMDVKPWDKGVVYDTMIAWTGDPRERISMNRLCRILGLEDKGDELDGSKVWDWVASGRIKEVADYCDGDVVRARNMHKALTGEGAA